MSYSLNSLKGLVQGNIVGVIKGNTSSLDSSSYTLKQIALHSIPCSLLTTLQLLRNWLFAAGICTWPNTDPQASFKGIILHARILARAPQERGTSRSSDGLGHTLHRN